MVSLQRTQEIGWKVEDKDSYGTDPITSIAKAISTFGLFLKSFGAFPELNTEVLSSYNGSDYDPVSLDISNTKVGGTIAGVMLNGIPFYMVSGRIESSSGLKDGGVTKVAAVYLVDGVPDGELASYTIRMKTSNAIGTIEKSITGVRFNAFTMSLDNKTKRSPLVFSLGYEGRLMAAPAASTSDYTLTDPDNISTPFYWEKAGNNAAFTWDADDDANDLTDILLHFSYTQATLNRAVPKRGQHYPNWIVTGDRAHMITFSIERRSNTTVFDDYMLQAGTGAVPTQAYNKVHFTIGNSNGKGIAFVFTDVVIKTIKMNDAFIEGKEVPTYDVTCFVRKVQGLFNDGVTTDTFYGIGT